MYTFLRPREKPIPTRTSINNRGGLQLYHSLDVKRLVAFVGSGVSAAYGRPSWQDLVKILLRVSAHSLRCLAGAEMRPESFNAAAVHDLAFEACVILGITEERFTPEEVKVCRDRLPHALRKQMEKDDPAMREPAAFVCAQIYLTAGQLQENVHRAQAQNITALLELCETMMREAGRPTALRRAVEWTFRPNGQVQARLYAAGFGIEMGLEDEDTAPWLSSEPTIPACTEDLLINRILGNEDGLTDLTGLAKNPSLEKFVYLKMADQKLSNDDGVTNVSSTIAEAARKVVFDVGEYGADKLEDPLYELRETLGIRRFLTINYDSEIETFLNERLGYISDTEESAPALRFRDGFGGIAEIGNATDDQIGQLVAFASVSNPSGVKVLHLHGQSRDPESLILTEQDYQRRYLGDTARRRAFHEALEALFTGNSILFVGVGMNEADLLQPFRQFASVTRGAETLHEPRYGQAFAMLPYESPDRASSKALELDQTYGVSARFFGYNTGLREMREFLKALRRVVDLHLGLGEEEEAFTRAARNCRVALKALARHQLSLSTLDATPVVINDGDMDAADVIEQSMRSIAGQPEDRRKILLYKVEAKILGELFALCDKPLDEIKDAEQRSREQARRAPSQRLMEVFFAGVEADVLSRSLCQELKRTASSRHRWATEWSQTPAARRAIFRNISPYGDAKPIWSRHQINLYPIDGAASELHDNPLYDRLHELARGQDNMQTDGGRRILRAAIGRGGGKGSILRAMIEDLKQGSEDLSARIFPRVGSVIREDFQDYQGAFITHSNFLTEYGTVSAALYRFIRIAMAKAFDTDTLPVQEGRSLSEAVLDPAALDRFERAVLSPGAPLRKVTYEGRQNVGGHPFYAYEEDEDYPLLGGVDRIPLLRAALHRIAALGKGEDKRWLVVLTGVDRLCEAGRPVSSTIEVFFRVLTDPSLAQVPLDILLVSGDTRHAIAGLSTEDERTPAGEARRPVALERAPWPELRTRGPKEIWKGRPWRQQGDNEPFGRALNLLISDLKRPLNVPDLEVMLARNRVLDCWVSLLLRDMIRRDDASDLPRRNDRSRPDVGRIRLMLENMNAAARGGRIHRVIDIVLSVRGRIERIDPLSHRNWAALKESILRHLSLVTIPIEREVLLSIPEIASYLDETLKAKSTKVEDQQSWIQERKRAWDVPDQKGVWDRRQLRREAITQCLTELIDAGLVIPVEARNPLLKDAAGDKRYGVHSLLRQCVTRKMNLPLRDLAQRNLYDVSVHDILPRDLPTPGHPEFRQITGLVENLIEASRRDIQPWVRWTERNALTEEERANKRALLERFDEEVFHAISRRLRACFSILHGVLSIGAIARLDRAERSEQLQGDVPFEAYRGIIRSLLNAATAVAHIRRAAGFGEGGPPPEERVSRFLDLAGSSKIDKEKFTRFEDAVRRMREPLHLSEIVWLYNERALISFLQGRMFDSLALYDLAQDKAAAPTVPLPLEDNPTLRRIKLSRALVLLETGRLDDCREELNVLLRGAGPVEEMRESALLATGYLGLCAHLEGRFDTASRHYQDAIAEFEKRHNLRAVASFSRLFSDLLRRDRKSGEALEKIERAKIAAARQEHRDLYHHALVSHARLLRDENEQREAAKMLRKAEEYARAMGSHKIAADALRCMAHLMLGEGETEYAGRLAIEAMAISSICGMRLRKIANVILYGEVLAARDQPLYARPILRQALYDAERCGYQLKASRAADLLHDIDTRLNSASGLSSRPPVAGQPAARQSPT